MLSMHVLKLNKSISYCNEACCLSGSTPHDLRFVYFCLCLSVKFSQIFPDIADKRAPGRREDLRFLPDKNSAGFQSGFKGCP